MNDRGPDDEEVNMHIKSWALSIKCLLFCRQAKKFFNVFVDNYKNFKAWYVFSRDKKSSCVPLECS